ncbi:speckle-type POZ protein B-like [Microplitis mediator]|uniref:speckle-type POZ protein B-like n=1 Tax=Microplitis mediator TaxID=375433 RepID=UPI002552662E|nr:speckle-type POZ protein B-like [Microplitis mediator]
MEILGYSHCQQHQVIYKWEVNEITSFIESAKNEEETVKLNSSNFATNDKTENSWYLQLSLSKEKEWVSLFLLRNNGKNKVRTEISLFLLNSRNDKKFQKTAFITYDLNKSYGTEHFLEIKELLKNKDDLIPNNTLTVCAKLTVYDDYKSITTDYPMRKRQRKITDDLKELFDTKINSDVIFVVGNEKFKAHKFILSTRSPVFSAMFTHEMKEKKDSEVTIPDIDPDIFNKMLKFIYTDEINNLDIDAVYLLEAADKYQLLNLKSLCEESLPKSVRIDNAIKLMILADLHNANQLLEFIFEFMIKNIKDITKTPEYEVLGITKPLLLLKLIKKIANFNENQCINKWKIPGTSGAITGKKAVRAIPRGQDLSGMTS